VDPFYLLNWSLPSHEAMAIDVANPLNPRNLPMIHVKQNIVEMCFYPVGEAFATNYTCPTPVVGQHWSSMCAPNSYSTFDDPSVNISGGELCMSLKHFSTRVGRDFTQCCESSDGMFLTLWMGTLFGWAGLIDTFTRWNKWDKDGTPNDRGHIKCVGSFIFILTTCIDAAGFTNYHFNCVSPLENFDNCGASETWGVAIAGPGNIKNGLGYRLLWLQFILAHTGDIFKLLIPAIDVREMEQYGSAKTGFFGQVVKAASTSTATTDVEMQDTA